MLMSERLYTLKEAKKLLRVTTWTIQQWDRFLKMWGQGFAPKGAKLHEMLPMNSEGDEGDETQGLSMYSI
jgi:hypothetical protein